MSYHGWGKFSNLWCSNYWESAFVNQKIKTRQFYSWTPGITPKQKEITHSSQAVFFQKFIPQQNGGLGKETESLRIIVTKLLLIYMFAFRWDEGKDLNQNKNSLKLL